MRPAFTDPVQDAQSCFRAVLEAMSRPGRIQVLEGALTPPAALHPSTAAVLLTLADAETPLHHDAGAEADAWLRFHCGCPVASAAEAAFVLAVGQPPMLSSLAQGSDEEPERGATLVLQVPGLESGHGWRLTGPGIAQEHRLRVEGLPPGFLAEWRAQRAGFPRGVDIILCAGTRIAALPRGIRIEEG
ncbi:phosphonate C-P lyase system protein PhnH [Roseomonas sp. ACRSG]|nr:phosphonate C-P lyase system protein PhnH [Roseomonas sp. ACRSG]